MSNTLDPKVHKAAVEVTAKFLADITAIIQQDVVRRFAGAIVKEASFAQGITPGSTPNTPMVAKRKRRRLCGFEKCKAPAAGPRYHWLCKPHAGVSTVRTAIPVVDAEPIANGTPKRGRPKKVVAVQAQP